MIVDKILKNGAYVPDLPSYLESTAGEALKYNTCELIGDKYHITFSEEQMLEFRITNVEAKAELNKRGLLATVEGVIENGVNENLKIWWNNATFWDKRTDALKAMALQLNVNLDEFFTAAKLNKL